MTMTTMKAARFHGVKDLRIEEVERRKATAGKALIQVEWCGICGTDLSEYLYGPISIPRPDRPHPVSGAALPVIMGHEFCGVVVDAPEGSQLTKGQAVMVDPRINCSSCGRCSGGNSHACDKMGFLGLSGVGGGLSEFVAVEPKMLHVLPDSVSLKDACLIEPLAVAWHAAKMTGIDNFRGVPVLILGGGPIGFALVFVLRAKGADKIYISEPAKARRVALESVADLVIDPKEDNVAAKCKELTNGEGVGAVFDCAGVQASFNSGIDSLVFKGTFINVAGWHHPMSVSTGQLMFKEPTVRGSLAYNESDFAEVVAAFIEGKFKGVERMITSRIPLADVEEKGFKQLIENKDNHIKIVVTPKPQ